MVKATDDFFVSGKAENVKHFMRELGNEFTVCKVSIGGIFRFIGCEIDVGEEVIEMSM